MKTGTLKRISRVEDDFWTAHLQLLTAQFPTYYTKPQKVWGRFHISKEEHKDSSHEIVPISERKGKRTYVMMHPYVLEPNSRLPLASIPSPKNATFRNAP